MDFLNKAITVVKSDNTEQISTEEKVLREIDWIMKKWPIDHLTSREDFIKFLFSTYFYTSKFKPFIPVAEVFYRYYLITLIIWLIIISFVWGLMNNTDNRFYKELWIILSNITYLLFSLYIPIRIYGYIRKLIRNETTKTLRKTITFWVIKIILFYWFIPFTFFIWSLTASIVNVLGITVEWIIYELK